MYYEEYGKNNKQILLMLHGANFVHVFGRQYLLSDNYRILIPHLMGFGKDASRSFNTNTAITELAEFIVSLGTKVTLAGFSLGAQLGFRLICEYPELFNGAILVSPWLIKETPSVAEIVDANLKQLSSFQHAVDNGISLDSVCGFEQVPFPVVALAGGLEEDVVKDSIKTLAAQNPNCRYEIWVKAGHNIPPLHYKRFNKLICDTMKKL